MANDFLKVIKDAGLSHEEILKILEEKGKIKSPQTYEEIYKAEEAKRLAKEKAEKDKETPPAEPAAPPEEPTTPPAEPPKTLPEINPVDKKLKELETKMTKLIEESTKIPLATPSKGESNEKKKVDDLSLAITGKYEKYI